MSNNANSRRKIEMPGSVRSKFVAALCMLLVSAIMLISSTYAWFTLSTAPEVKGITTQVGANGNLEMMLLNATSFASSAEDLGVQSDVGQSMTVKEVEVANETWGNLVDLSSGTYGLTNMFLMPAKLNVTGGEEKNTVNESILLAPAYGSDGRVIDVKTPTYTANYDKTAGFKYVAGAAGVRAIGTTSGVTLRISAYRTALSSAASAAASAQAAAQRSLSENAQDIANLLMQQAQGATTFDVSYLDTIQKILTGIEDANEYVDTAIRQYALAYTLSAANTDDLTDDAVSALVSAATGDDWTTLNQPTGLSDVVTARNTMNSTITTAQTDLNTLKATNPTSLTWDQISPIFEKLVNRNGATIAGKPASGTVEEILGDVVDGLIAGQGVQIGLGEGSGIYYDIAVITGSFAVSTQVRVDYDSPGIHKDVPATITAGIGSAEAKLTTVRNSVTTAGAPEETVGSGSTVTLSDTYGYALDFGFRTNAASSNLLLQTAAANRVYSSSTTGLTQGSGSNLLFTTNDVNTFDLNDVRGLMSAVRIAFVAPAPTENYMEYELLAMAKLDIDVKETDGYKTYEGGTKVGENGVQADLYLCEYEIDGDGYVSVKDAKADKSVITSLQQNVAKKVTVIVYLDGEIVDNTMVANAEKSVSGALNLQFASSATLVPMSNSSLMSQNIDLDNDYTDYTPSAEYIDALKEKYPALNVDSVKFYQAKDASTTPQYCFTVDGGSTIVPFTLPSLSEDTAVTP